MKNHPDRGGDHKKFAQINEAYETLSNPQKRQQYDNPRTQFHFNSDNFEDIFARGFGGFNRRATNQNIQIGVDITLKDVYNGKELIVNYQLPSGRVETAQINLPRGAKNGDTIRYKGMGGDAIPNMPRGDLLVTVRYINNKDFDISGIDLYAYKELNIFDLILGTEIEITTPEDKRIKLKIPPKTQPDTSFGITGHGLPNRNNGRQGNIIVKVKAKIPKDIDQNILDAIEKSRS
jgi:curved DNA-binding protein